MTDVDRSTESDDRRFDPQHVTDERPDEDAYHRCGGCLDPTHWVRISIHHRGQLAGGFTDVTRTFCPDCVAAVGLLELAAIDRTGIE